MVVCDEASGGRGSSYEDLLMTVLREVLRYEFKWAQSDGNQRKTSPPGRNRPSHVREWTLQHEDIFLTVRNFRGIRVS